jgi:response regulator NasT
VREAAKILIVEDEYLTYMLLKLHLTRVGFEVCPNAANSDKAVTICERERPDLVIMDIRLYPGLDGFGAAKLLRRIDPALPIIFISGYNNDDLADRLAEADAVAFLQKPVDLTELVDIIKAFPEPGDVAEPF